MRPWPTSPRWQRRLTRWTFLPWGFCDPLPCLWSKGVARLCDVRGPRGYWDAPTESVRDETFFRRHYSGAHGLVWLRLSTLSRAGVAADIDHFAMAALPAIRRPFVLVTTDGDVSVPSELRPATVDALLSSPFLVAWYTQNHDGSGAPRIAPFPIGLDLHTPRPMASPQTLVRELRQLAARRPAPRDQPLTVFSDVALNPASEDRRRAAAMLAGCPHVELQAERVSQRAIWERYAAHPFVLSLAGNGRDCHRTWEALYLGSIVITKRSPIDPLFAGLPVLAIDGCAELLDRRNLARWLDRYASLAEPGRVWRLLDAKSYVDRIRAAHLPGQG